MTPRSRLRSVASIHEAALRAACVRDLADIGDYIRTRNPAAAPRVREAILETLRMLRRFPMAGRAQRVEGVRKIVTRRYAYIVYYRVDEIAQEIVVAAIQHPSRARPYQDR